ncbi:Helicase superfamily protein [Candidatus Glomeribacter gigasporarum BEG34]|uniref:Helicase superfamily protein n=1 Tax=Candidatus Glomeribacter gigasporarum BEG34 TaxID=1070319 RepID=G2JAQ3_9BURK|nr:DEAD/DEAH box helicase [Candidatus Glomeribacter gigasporarum]CCD29855.1 Helicase superfamily protein [Candidatus Glomeribacter gigasporarum BEG34]
MVDFDKLKTKKTKSRDIEPTEIFRRLPKPSGINDLYTSQAEVLQAWFKRRQERDVVLKLHTGGGKTLVGLLMAQSTLNETREPVLYLAPTVQLVNQTLEKAKALGISAVPYERGQPLNDDFVNGNAIMVGTYKALFNGRSKFGLRGGVQPQQISAVILDDAHAAFSVVRESFTLDVRSNKNRPRYESLTDLFRKAFKELNKLGTFDDIVSGAEYSVLEVPYWAWHEQIDAAREQLKSDGEEYALVWPLLRDRLHLCHALISRDAFTLTPILPLVNAFPTFVDAPRRIYMSATIADDSEIVRTFDADPQSAQNPLTSRSLAGVSERMILIPDFMPFKLKLEAQEAIKKLMVWTTNQNLGVVVLVSSDKAAAQWSEAATIAQGSQGVERRVAELQARTMVSPVVFVNRYDGIDLPGNSCRLLIMSGLPAGTSNYELFRASALFGGATITRMLAQRIEQGIGRGARGSGDHCVVLLAGSNLAGWVSKDTNFRFFTGATRAQLEMGAQISRAIKDSGDLIQTIQQSFGRDKDWVKYHAETLAELVDEEVPDKLRFNQAAMERKAVNLWHDGYHEQALAKIEKFLTDSETLDPQIRGWMAQLAARIANQWGHSDRSEDLQRQAYAHNRNLLTPKVLPPYRPLLPPGAQAKAIAEQFGHYRFRRGLLQSFEDVAIHLHRNASANQFEEALAKLAVMIGLSSERHDDNGKGPDVLWLLPNKVGFVIEVKSRKKAEKALTKEEHGQLLVAAEWFAENYKDYQCVRVCVHPGNYATKAAMAGTTYALTYEKLAALVSDARSLFSSLCESQLSGVALETECDRQLTQSSLKFDQLMDNYLVPFEEQD